MTDSTVVLADALKTQRQTLSHQRRLKAWQGVWRFAALCGMTGGLVWSLGLPDWVIRGSSQVKITGNQLLNLEQIQQMLQMNYPQSIWQLPIHQLTEQLESQPPIEDIHITRQLFPAQITLTVKERQPVAKASFGKEGGFLDAEGVWIPQKFYPQGAKIATATQLTILGLNRQSQTYWEQMYPMMISSPVKIMIVDWRDPSNLILKTDLGTVHCGTYDHKFSQQLSVLAKLRKLPSQVPKERIIYIDLSNPDSPSVHLKDPPKKPPSS
ncbi:FtsQ-type POTRA domain-containing protein [Crocosphaera sp. UHCC 0190]|uniref:cell division protein FtsQ/DivIB n=1 Tax=Crocosphaera sp. UHCC 0190 TaxID=3110246 RepID=UPI002B2166AD|nr:FtsQ-type POTRA domain-containing protein [Crocosphaera sp. UHCC 0190]MEA5511528.1 FtsQ-type POTRA domain-containing protein [Crocosphaera sp. UHCC 0190]